MRFNKMFILERNGLITIRNQTTEVCLHRDDLSKYYPALDLTEKNRVNYEPDTGPGFFIDESKPDGIIPKGEYQQYEDAIVAADQIKANMADPFFNKTAEEAKVVKKALLKREARETILSKWDYEDQIDALMGIRADLPQIKADIQAVRDAYATAITIIDSSATVNEIKNVTVGWPTL